MNLNGQERKVLFLLIFCVLIGTGIWFWQQNQKEQESLDEVAVQQENQQPKEDKEEPEIYVYLTGAVKNPGVYKVTAGTRLFQVVEMAGGAAPTADLEAVNLAEKVADGIQIHIPMKGEAKVSAKTAGSQMPAPAAQTDSGGLININTASQEQLDTLPGIGEATAQKIIQYRTEHGAFASVEEIKNVSGIGDKKYEKMKDMLTVQ